MTRRDFPTFRRYLTPDQRLLEIVERVRTIAPPTPEESSAEYEQGWQDACERIQELWADQRRPRAAIDALTGKGGGK